MPHPSQLQTHKPTFAHLCHTQTHKPTLYISAVYTQTTLAHLCYTQTTLATHKHTNHTCNTQTHKPTLAHICYGCKDSQSVLGVVCPHGQPLQGQPFTITCTSLVQLEEIRNTYLPILQHCLTLCYVCVTDCSEFMGQVLHTTHSFPISLGTAKNSTS